MKKKLQQGFGATETILIIVLVAIVAFVVWYVFHTKNNTNSAYNNASNSTNSTPSQSTKKTNSPNQTTASQIITTKTDSSGKQYLADGSGKTLYTYGADTNGVSNCTGSCLADWPIYKATSTTSLPANVTIITRSDGGTQYAYKGMPLYYFSGDTAAGQVTGDGVNNFQIARP